MTHFPCSLFPSFTDNSEGVFVTIASDADADGINNDFENCVSAANFDQTDTDGDGDGDACDNCPPVANANQENGDGDTAGDACDECLSDPDKSAPGQCGCGIADTDTDSDATADCNDGCSDDPAKIAPGECGCGVPDADANANGTPDCNDPPPPPAACGTCAAGVLPGTLLSFSLMLWTRRRHSAPRR
ncbi:MAG TPA: hypothetical protein VJZ71_10470 [Phycisphaerae bacterium]|nr:hypothetical protein [Phycisphaerae bacterium]